ncbi:MAG TPA: putative zinc-binding metallopeptidase [Steroidobacteraceae bacterium]|nr:putative zinc-binding metallopeptidase [Steroidobacteraceae bacterium]
MRNFRCQCGATVFFENTRCISCSRKLGFLPDRSVMSALEPAGENLWRAPLAGMSALYRSCANTGQGEVCNWMVPRFDAHPFCTSCRLNQIIPNLDAPQNRLYWKRIEAAKRRLVYSLLRLGLPIIDRQQDPAHGLAFNFLADQPDSGEFSDSLDPSCRVMTGHVDGVITINVAEADDVERERIRMQMNENYRTLLGHVSHEIAHYYWPLLVRDTGRLDAFRDLFGDETADYAAALDAYYEHGAPPGWQTRYVSAYASAHPWEDWAESFAHYLHMTDTLEAAADAGILPGMSDVAALPRDVEALMNRWREFAVVLNSLNRCMGLPDAYPFVLSGKADEKIAFVHAAIRPIAQPLTPSRIAADA